MAAATATALSLSSSSSSPNFLQLRRFPRPEKGSRLPRAALVEAKPLPALRGGASGGSSVNGEYAVQVVDAAAAELSIRSRMDRAGDIQAEARAMTRAVNTSVYSPELVAARYGSRPIKVLQRTVEILTAVGSFAFKLFLDKRLGLLDQRKRMRAAELRRIFTRLGPTFVKIGQGLSTRPDICPPEFLEELSELQDLQIFCKCGDVNDLSQPTTINLSCGNVEDADAPESGYYSDDMDEDDDEDEDFNLADANEQFADIDYEMHEDNELFESNVDPYVEFVGTTNKDALPTFPDAEAFACIERELGLPIDSIYSALSPSPIAAASLGQVYKAQLRLSGELVAVKVQRPGIEEAIGLDFYLLRGLGFLINKYVNFISSDVVALIDEFARRVYQELNYVQEGKNARRFKKLYADKADVLVPDIFWDYTSAKVLTMEWVDGVKLNQQEAIEKQGLKLLELVNIGIQCSLRQLLEYGYFHADPHPGNLLATPEGKLAFLDFGMMSETPEQARFAIIGHVVHLVNRDYEAMARDYYDLDFLSPDVDVSPIVPALRNFFDDVLNATVSELNFKTIVDGLGTVLYDYPFNVPAYYALILRSLTVLEGLALYADPNFKVLAASWNRLENLLVQGRKDKDFTAKDALQPVLKLLLDPEGEELRVLVVKESVYVTEAVVFGSMIDAFNSIPQPMRSLISNGNESGPLNLNNGERERILELRDRVFRIWSLLRSSDNFDPTLFEPILQVFAILYGSSILSSNAFKRDSFITHRAFCDALAEESARAITANPLVSHHPLLFPAPPPPPQPPITLPPQPQFPHLIRSATAEPSQELQELVTLKRETQQPPFNLRQEIPSWLSSQGNNTSPLNYHDLPFSLYASRMVQENGIPHHLISTPAPAMAPAPHMSATALLQKAAQMGAISASSKVNATGLGLSSSHQQETTNFHGSASQSPFLQDLMMKSMPQASLFDDHGRREEGRNGNDGLTRDFLGLRAISQRDLLNMAGIETCMSNSYDNQKKKSWLGN
ncbi:putative aarF domain-containing protein kinase [Dendrobium catenatum]|uniref:Putative aarF domain-containing protein kinase n=1 Tax=Dendrobium catenatum TaxID=906689 RepID=A0A2I0W603_9ASPA|nr:putative aarF domain-containing protein kinase [Dendrobium catenatum]